MKVDIMWEFKQTESLINNNLYDWSLARFCTQVDIALISGKYIKILFKRRNWKPRDEINNLAVVNNNAPTILFSHEYLKCQILIRYEMEFSLQIRG